MMPEVQNVEDLHKELERLLNEQKILEAKTNLNKSEISAIRLSLEHLGYPHSTFRGPLPTEGLSDRRKRAASPCGISKQRKFSGGYNCEVNDSDESDVVECLQNSSIFGNFSYDTDPALATNLRTQSGNRGNDNVSIHNNSVAILDNNVSNFLGHALTITSVFTTDTVQESSNNSESDEVFTISIRTDMPLRSEEHITAANVVPEILNGSPSKDIKYPLQLKKSRAGNIANAVIAANPLGRIRIVPLGSGYQFHKRALLKYKELYGDMMVRHTFIIPWIDSWQEEMWGLKLGQLVCIQIRNQEKYKEHREDLIKIGFNYHRQKVPAHGFEKVKSALILYKQINNHTIVPNKYVIPVDTVEWPNIYWGMKLHSVLHDIKRGHAYTDENRKILIDLGFGLPLSKTEIT